MAYTIEILENILTYNIKPASRIMDIGSQDFFIRCNADIESVNSFIEHFNGKPYTVERACPYKIEVKEIFERAGHTHFCCDVDERPGTIKIDLCKMVFPKAIRSSMDVVINAGTTEHLANPIAAFALMHYLTKIDGLMFHYVLLFGLGNHGLLNPTPKFWHALFWMNSYQVLLSEVNQIDETLRDSGNFYHDYLSYMTNLIKAKNVSYRIKVVLKKTIERIFIPPYDAVLPESDGLIIADLLAGLLYPFLSTGAYTVDEVIVGINEFLKLQHLPYRYSRKEFLKKTPDHFFKTKSRLKFQKIKLALLECFINKVYSFKNIIYLRRNVFLIVKTLLKSRR